MHHFQLPFKANSDFKAPPTAPLAQLLLANSLIRELIAQTFFPLLDPVSYSEIEFFLFYTFVVFLRPTTILTCANGSCNNDRNIDFSSISIFIKVASSKFSHKIGIKS